MPTFGYTTVGSSQGGGLVVHGTVFTLSENTQSLESISVRVYDNFGTSSRVKCAIYDYTTRELVPSSETPLSSSLGAFFNDWVTFTYSPVLTLSAGQYILAAVTEHSTLTIKYDTGDTGQGMEIYAGIPNTAATFPKVYLYPTTISTRKNSIYCTYSSLPVLVNQEDMKNTATISIV